MAELYESEIETRVKRLRRTAIATLMIGGAIGYSLVKHRHWLPALLDAIITVQATAGSLIMMGDAKRDLRDVQRTAQENR